MFGASKTASVSGGGTDPQFDYVTLLLNGDGTNGAQNNTFIDSSSNNFTITRNGNTTQGSFSPYGSLWSNYFDGTGNHIKTPSSGQFAPTGDFTVECWYYPMTVSNYNPIMGNWTSGNTGNWLWEVNSTGQIQFYVNGGGATRVASSGGAIVVGNWYHLAVVRSGSTVTAYINGTSIGTVSYSGTYGLANQSVGIGSFDGDPCTGYISNVRLVDGTAVYTTNFTPSTIPLTAISGTKLLTCQSNRFIDNSSVANALTITGTPSVQRFSPFNPTAPYDTATIGGSGYFNGAGYNLSIADSSAFPSGTVDFCYEAWVYLAQSNNGIVLGKGGSSIYEQADIHFNGSTWEAYISNPSNVYILNAAQWGNPSVGAWNHVALYRSGNNFYGSSNGIVTLLATSSQSVIDNSGPFCIGDLSNASGPAGLNSIRGYITNVRVVKNSSVYGASNFTPPTSPLTAITNTQLLCNMINAGIPDLAMMNDIETVGNAQVSTSVKKFGTGSLAFDGSGDYLKGNNSLSLGSGNFTVECWVYVSAFVDGDCLLTIGTNNSFTNMMIRMNSNWTISIGDGSSWVFVDVTFATKQIGQWAHIAIVRNNGTLTAYYNGVSGYSTSNTTNLTQTGITVGNYASLYLNGYVDDLRITKGYARYTANFTPPTSALPTY